jgi:cohesin complex subunit SCC1
MTTTNARQAFRPGNIDLPAQTHVANRTNLILPYQITDLDLLAPMPDLSLLLLQPLDGNLNPDWDNSQFLSGSIEQAHMEPMELLEDDLNLDIGESDDLEPGLADDEGTSIEVGRNAPLERRQYEEFTGLDKNLVIDKGDLGINIDKDDLGIDIDEDDLGINIGKDPPTELARGSELNLNDDMYTSMGGMSKMNSLAGSIAGNLPMRQREESPLSELGKEEATCLEQEDAEQNATMFEPEQKEEESVHQACAKRRRVVCADAETMISTQLLREQQYNRDKIFKPSSFLPRDPLLIALLNMQKSGGFVSSILGDGQSQGWAPELRNILSLEQLSMPLVGGDAETSLEMT